MSVIEWHNYTFVWSPEGRPVATYKAASESAAKRQFKRDYRNYAKYMGEVYIVVDEPEANRQGYYQGEAY